MQLEQQQTFEIRGPQLEVLGRAEDHLPAPARRRPVGALALAVLALVSVFGIGGVKLKARQASVTALYTTATNEYGDGIQTDLDAQADAAASLIRLAGRLLGESDPTVTAAAAALDAWNALPALPAAQYAGNADLYAAVGDVYIAARTSTDESTRDQLDALYAEFTSRQALVERAAANTYNPAAQQFNRELGELPAGIIGALWGVEPAQLFAPTDTASSG